MTDLQIANIRHALVALLDGGRVMSGPNTWQLNDDGSLCLLVTRRSCTGFDEVLLKNDLPFQQLCQLLGNQPPETDFTFRERDLKVRNFTDSPV